MKNDTVILNPCRYCGGTARVETEQHCGFYGMPCALVMCGCCKAHSSVKMYNCGIVPTDGAEHCKLYTEADAVRDVCAAWNEHNPKPQELTPEQQRRLILVTIHHKRRAAQHRPTVRTLPAIVEV